MQDVIGDTRTMALEKRKYECSALPKGWQREEVIRKSGLSAGKVDVYYYSPNGKKFRSKPQLARYLGDALDLATFDFRSGKINSLLLRKNKKQRGTQFDYRGVRNDASLVPPIRQTASIFKQPVTVHKMQEGKVKTDFKHGPQEKPKQLFWEKRLEGLRACDLDGTEFDAMELPRALRPVGPHVGDETLLQSVATALHVSAQPVTGQTGSRTVLDKNPGVFLNPEQPLVQAVTIADEDIKRQEERVASARKKLQEALKRIVA
ncbi:methyl-CpG-binding domain protein 2 isoform X2 [Schistocerca americana]|uniref:methyl-CpG-binding domain protein 2 isoform X2 n=1 Tax=Schistocerca americana TaxID=7009 RepID=UPI001F4F5C17|nr:methyl-CpG-binding domain protein 2 isoform X2 [Schistocerca americana]XP_047121271.1 methyl-CpG-binding domain protein 2 isoform X2 [Schistocerca piceifrons]XP_049764971.1 methyl-CpG-binding domain protein 2 isoform X2 [Schistocerca cancellata]XP_049791890.1 methyl-CpG-binding domain protein 2 isoform X2 [Schistocerca nitens]XP_049837625.1 methyl-CpG-binding domain protein 2 isoform X2 [Schistocerca gregaria]XP_049937694.1 methyl-CpG-binding domain protein 2 isoform X2 [Schistocerca serial